MYLNRRLTAFLAALSCGLFAPAIALADTPVPLSTEAQVRDYFWDLPVMAAIARCESEFTQFNPSGTVLHGGYKGRMIGIYQIAPMHLPEAAALGLDVNTINGNMAFARHLYEMSGTSPWEASRWCWQHLPETHMVVSSETKIAMIQKQIDSIKAALAKLH